MRMIEVEDDIFEFLVGKITGFGETPSAVLRRELNLRKQAHLAPLQTQPAISKTAQTASPLAKFVDRPEFLVHPDVVSRYLGLLSWLYNRDPEGFKRITAIGGRKRKYFALSSQELDASGRMVMPKGIPNSPFWAVTNNATALKRKILEQVMRVLGYSPADIGIALSVLK